MVDKPNIVEHDFHPLADEYPLMSDQELELLAANMKQYGYDPRFPIVTYEEKIISGRDRYRAARIAGVVPRFVALGAGEDPAAFAARENDLRKHFSQESLRARRAKRLER